MKYLAVMVDFLDRSTGRVTRELCYPVTGVYLIEDPEDFNHGLKAFTVTEDQTWQPVPSIPPLPAGPEEVATTSDSRAVLSWRGNNTGEDS